MSELSKLVPIEPTEPPVNDGIERKYSHEERENIRAEAKDFLKDSRVFALEVGRSANTAINTIGKAVDTVKNAPLHAVRRKLHESDKKKIETQTELVRKGAKFRIVQQSREKKLKHLTALAAESAKSLAKSENARMKHKRNVQKREDRNVTKTELLIDKKKSGIGKDERREFLISLKDEGYDRKERRLVKRSLNQKQKAEFGNITILRENSHQMAQDHIRHDPVNESRLRKLIRHNEDLEALAQAKDTIVSELNEQIKLVNITTQNPIKIQMLRDQIAGVTADKVRIMSQRDKNKTTITNLAKELEIDLDNYTPSGYFAPDFSNQKDQAMREKEANKRHRKLIENIANNQMEVKTKKKKR